MVLNWQSLISAALAAALCACAQNSTTESTTIVPDNIAPMPIKYEPYMGFTCQKLEQNLGYIAQELEEAISKPADNTKGNIAHLKGETEAVKKAMLLKRCPQVQQAAPAEAKKTQ